MDVVIAGYGSAGELHARLLACRPDIRITGIADATAARRTAASARFPSVIAAAGLDELEVPADVVIVCTPPARHEPDTRTALIRHRAHVLCEKPAVLDPATGRQLGKAAADAGLVLHPVHNYLHSPAIDELRTIATRSIGPITHATITILRPAPARGHLGWRPDWRTDPAAGGGILYDHGPHACYLACHLTGQAVRSARGTTLTGEHGADHEARLHLDLTDGATATITLSWQGIGRTNTYELHGAHGSARLHNGRLELTTGTSTRTSYTEDHSAGGHTHQKWTEAVHRTFLDRIHRSDHDTAPWDMATHVAEILTAAGTGTRTAEQATSAAPRPAEFELNPE